MNLRWNCLHSGPEERIIPPGNLLLSFNGTGKKRDHNIDPEIYMRYLRSVRSIWPSPFGIFFERDKERGQYSAILTDQPWSIKDLSILPKRELFAGPSQEIPSEKLGSQSERRIRLILPTRRLSHLIKGFINWRSYYQMTLKQRRLWRTWLATGEQFPSKGDAMATVILLMRINEIS